MNYSQLSDFEINKLVAIAAGFEKYMSFNVDEGCTSGPVWTVSCGHYFSGTISSKGSAFNPCNNPAEAWPIIFKNNITILLEQDTMPCAMGGVTTGQCIEISYKAIAEDENPLRAAMIVFLMMQEE